MRTLRDGGYRAFESLRSGGSVRAIGIGVNEREVLIEAMEWGAWDAFLLAGRYTLLEQAPLDDLLPKCLEAGTSIVVGGPLNSGILAGRDTWNYRAHHPRSSPGPMRSRLSATAIACLFRQRHCNSLSPIRRWRRSFRARAMSTNFTPIWACCAIRSRPDYGRTFATPDCSIRRRRPQPDPPNRAGPRLSAHDPLGMGEHLEPVVAGNAHERQARRLGSARRPKPSARTPPLK